MKKSLTLLLFVFSFGLITAQQKTAAKPSGAGALSDKNWTIVSTEEWGVEKKPNDKNKDDFMLLKSDGSFSMKREGQAIEGTYKKTGAYIYFTPTDAAIVKFNYKVVSTEGNILKVDYREAEGLHTLYTFNTK